MVGKINIGKLHIRGVLRHRYEKGRKDDYLRWNEFRDWRLGVWFRKYKAVGHKNFKEPSKWSDNLASVHQLGIDLLVIKAWIEIDYGVKHFEI